MAQRKVYQSLVYQHFSMYALVNDKKIRVAFTGGSLQPQRNGTYSTSDPEVIKVLDDPATGLGKTYKCIAVEQADDEPVEEVSEKKDNPAVPSVDTSDFIKVSGIKTAQKAKDYLLTNVTGLTGVMLPNLAAIKKVATENKIHFTELP